MKKQESEFSIRKRMKSFKHAFKGLGILLRYEHNSRIHLFFAIVAVAAGFLLKISTLEWLIIIIIISMVLLTEILNSAIEYLSDFVSKEHDITIGKVKDLSSSAVLITAIASVIMGLIIFLPKIIDLF